MGNSRKLDSNGVSKGSRTKAGRDESDDEVNGLFKLPLAEFTGARNALAMQLKKSGRGDEAALVKVLTKPSVSAWAVNQLFWNYREAFDRLIESAERFHRAQASRGGGKVADMREAIDTRREALSQLSDIASSVLRDAGHTPSPDTIHRVTTTLEGISAYASRADDGPRPGRLTHDVDPPGFESFGGFVPGMAKHEAGGGKQKAVGKTQEAGGGKLKDDARQEETRKAKIAAAKVSLQDAKRSLTEARARVQRLEAAQKKADTKAKKAENELKKVKAASEDAARRAHSVAAEVEEAAGALDDAERAVEEASEELESLT